MRAERESNPEKEKKRRRKKTKRQTVRMGWGRHLMKKRMTSGNEGENLRKENRKAAFIIMYRSMRPEGYTETERETDKEEEEEEEESDNAEEEEKMEEVTVVLEEEDDEEDDEEEDEEEGDRAEAEGETTDSCSLLISSHSMASSESDVRAAGGTMSGRLESSSTFIGAEQEREAEEEEEEEEEKDKEEDEDEGEEAGDDEAPEGKEEVIAGTPGDNADEAPEREMEDDEEDDGDDDDDDATETAEAGAVSPLMSIVMSALRAALV